MQFADLAHLLREVEAMHPTSVGSVVNLSRNDIFCPVTDETSILDVCAIRGRVFGFVLFSAFLLAHSPHQLLQVVKILGDKGIHRVPVVDKSGKVTKIISQTALCSFLLEVGSTFSTPAKAPELTPPRFIPMQHSVLVHILGSLVLDCMGGGLRMLHLNARPSSSSTTPFSRRADGGVGWHWLQVRHFCQVGVLPCAFCRFRQPPLNLRPTQRGLAGC